MAWPTFPKPAPAKKRPNRTVSKARAARRRQDEAVKRAVNLLVDERDGHLCRHCTGNGAHHHHIVFRSQGGQHTTANIVTLCALCHDRVHARKLFISGNADLVLSFFKEPKVEQ